jgi:hypothetical protein
MIWLTLLPFSLFGSCGLSTIPLSVAIAFLLLGEQTRARSCSFVPQGAGLAGWAFDQRHYWPHGT